MSSATRPLITQTLARPVRRELPGRDTAKPTDRGDARKRPRDQRDAADDVAERMLAALTW